MNVATILKAKGTDVTSVSPDTTLRDVAVLLTERRIRRLAVIDDGKLVGVLSLGDVRAAKTKSARKTSPTESAAAIAWATSVTGSRCSAAMGT